MICTWLRWKWMNADECGILRAFLYACNECSFIAFFSIRWRGRSDRNKNYRLPQRWNSINRWRDRDVQIPNFCNHCSLLPSRLFMGGSLSVGCSIYHGWPIMSGMKKRTHFFEIQKETELNACTIAYIGVCAHRILHRNDAKSHSNTFR